MNTIILIECKYKQDKEKISNILTYYAFKQIHKDIYVGNLTKDEQDNLKEEFEEKTKKQDNIIVIPICKGCYKKIIQYGYQKTLEEEKYVIL